MPISFGLVLQQSWSRMVRMLFRPFRIEAWLTLGFASFLAGNFGRPGGGMSWRDHGHFPERSEAAHRVASFLLHPWGGALFIAAVVSCVLAALLLAWLVSHGKFVFLDNAVRERAAIIEPWKRTSRMANSLFLFAVVFAFACAGLFFSISMPVVIPVLRAIDAGSGWRDLIPLIAVWWVLVMAPLLLVLGMTVLFLDQVVVPIMHRDQIGAMAAWGRFFTLFRSRPLELIGFALLYFALSIAAAIAIVFAGFSTCCVGFIVLAIPYVNSVLLLPLHLTLRGLGPDFLAQCGPEWKLVGPDAPPAVPPAAPTAAPAGTPS